MAVQEALSDQSSGVPCPRDARGGEPILMPPLPDFWPLFRGVDEAQSMTHSI